MPLREKIAVALKDAMRKKEPHRLSTLRLINAAIKDQEIAQRSGTAAEQAEGTIDDATIRALLGRMVKQRKESARAYEEGGRLELAEQERAEIEVLEEFLPKQLTEKEIDAEVDAAIEALGATSIRDMGRVMARLKERHTGRMDFSAVGPMVKRKLSP